MEPSDSAASDKTSLRRDMQNLRQALTASERVRLDMQLCSHLLRFVKQEPGRAMAAFHAFGGEPDLEPALVALDAAEYQVHFPVLVDQHLHFRRWKPASCLTLNRYGIPEPLDGSLCAAERLDWVLMPLLAFSARGARLGMGGGYYDRSFAFRLTPHSAARPALIGVGYSLQELDSLPLQHWDVPLDGVLTDQGLRWFGSEPA